MRLSYLLVAALLLPPVVSAQKAPAAIPAVETDVLVARSPQAADLFMVSMEIRDAKSQQLIAQPRLSAKAGETVRAKISAQDSKLGDKYVGLEVLFTIAQDKASGTYTSSTDILQRDKLIHRHKLNFNFDQLRSRVMAPPPEPKKKG